MNLVSLKPEGKLVFVGDTHGDLDASVKVIENYFKSDTRICFLGDYVDRGPDSRGNIDYLLEKKDKNPDGIFLLQGNHENYNIASFSPCDFWRSLSWDEQKKYSRKFQEMPYALSADGIIALHGALPDIKDISEIDNVPGLENNRAWKAIMWGDFEEKINYDGSGRPKYYQEYFEKIMNRLEKNVLIRGHNPLVKESLYDNKCLTLFTSCAYNRKKTIAIADFDKKKHIETIDDLIVEEI